MSFVQQAPRLPNTYRSDAALREHLERLLPAEVLAEVEPELLAMGEAAAGELAGLAAAAEAAPPRLVPYDAWGRRVDRIEVSDAWRELHAVGARAGLQALPYEPERGPAGRVLQHALLHLFAPSSATVTCPLAMTDAAARVLLDHAPAELRDRVVPLLVSRDPARARTSGQWMTERTGGSDLSRQETVARLDQRGRWRLHGIKWFTSAVTADCALALARPEGAPAGAAGLGLFLVELADPREPEPQLGRTILVNRLKDKLGTRALPTAELTLAGALATPVGGVEAGVRKIAGMLNLTRVHNAISAAAGMRRGVDLALAYARVREASGRRLVDLPLHRETLAALAVEAEAAFALVARATALLGEAEQGRGGERQRRALRALVPTAKLLTGKDAVAGASEALEAFGGAGYIEDTGIPRLLRDAQVLPIWEGTTNVLCLDLLRAERRDGAVTALLDDLGALVGAARRSAPALGGAAELVAAAREALAKDLHAWEGADPEALQSHLRGVALLLGRSYAAGLLLEHAADRLARHGDGLAAVVAGRYAERWLRHPQAELPPAGRLAESARLLGEPS